jgi:putative phage-type endonuclease
MADIAEIVQGTEAWFAIRAGKVTASRIADLTAKTKSGPSESRKTYMGELIAERLTGNTVEMFKSTAMQWGTDNEPAARAAYAYHCNTKIVEIGFVVHPKISMSGASPDGQVNDDGLVEIKCPNTSTHIETLKSRKASAKYVKQIQWQLACTGRAWCDFFSFDPRLPDEMQGIAVRVMRDPTQIAELEAEVLAFIGELDATVAELQARYLKAAA